MDPKEEAGSSRLSKSNLSKNLPWIIVAVLALALVLSIVLWKPWQATVPANSRTLEVTGTAAVKSEPDEFVFYPSYQFKGSDKTSLIDQLTKKSTEIVTGLKDLGVQSKDIKSDASGYSNNYYFDSATNENVYSLSITVTSRDKAQTQKIQDYLVTTSPEGTVTPSSSFSDAKQKQLEDQARDKATKDARAKADKSAQNLGFKVAQVKSVVDGEGFAGTPMPYAISGNASTMEMRAADVKSSLPVQSGENELSYSVKVTYFIK